MIVSSNFFEFKSVIASGSGTGKPDDAYIVDSQLVER